MIFHCFACGCYFTIFSKDLEDVAFCPICASDHIETEESE